MTTALRLLGTTALLVALAAPPALAQTQPAVPSVTDGGEARDSGVGEAHSETWLGKPVVGADGATLGTLAEIRNVTATSDAGTMLVKRENGENVTVPLPGASFDGARVVAPITGEGVANPPAASVN